MISEEIQGRKGKLALFRIGSQTKPTLICIHGGPGLDHSSFLPGLSELSNQFQLLFLDLHGNGKSSAKGDFSLASYVEDIEDVLSTIKPKKPIGILGHSFGGSVAIKALASLNAAFNFGILVTTPLDANWIGYASQAIERMKNPTGEKIEKEFEKSSKSDEDYKRYFLAYAPIYFPELPVTEAKEIMGSWVYRSQPYLFATQHILPSMDLKESCAKIKVPCLVIGAEKDQLIPSSEAQRFVQLIPKAKSAIIEKAGHFPFLTRPENFKKAVETWWVKTKW